MATSTTTTNRRVRLRSRNNTTDFSKVGGLSNHIKVLREIIIFPLLYGDLYKHFNVKAPRGVLFFGPPGTGKTLVAGALATELNREGNGKVAFYQRKGADILDKWVGESERKLRDLFNQATKSKPSVIFFDELDGLAPVRSQKNDQVHCSIVATLLALMDGLDNMPGVIVIGATNRIDAIDPALRRPGRFDRELYFPLPSVTARKEILQVHTSSWKYKPTPEFLYKMAELTSGCCGSDLQAMCAEVVLCSLKRLYPNIHNPMFGKKVKINVDNIVINEIDFLNARMSLVPTSQRLGNYRVRKLSPFIKPLLQRQLDKISKYIHVLLPQFTQPFKKFLIGNERYAGRLVLKGSNQQGLTVHIVPAILQILEHIPCYMLDIPTLFENNIKCAKQNLPSILVLSRVDDWWDLIDSSTQLGLTAMLEDLHAGLPLFLIATCSEELPEMLQRYFYSNSSIVIAIDDPTVEEKENFFAPLFFGRGDCSVARILKRDICSVPVKKEVENAPEVDTSKLKGPKKRCARKRKGETDAACAEEMELVRIADGMNLGENSLPTSPLRKKRKLSCTSLHDGRLRGGGKDRTPRNNVRCCKNIRKCMNRHHPSQHSSLNNDDMTIGSNSSLDSFSREYFQGEPVRNPTLVDLIDCSSILDTRLGPTMAPPAIGDSLSALYDAVVKREPVSETSLQNHNPFDSSFYDCCNTNDPNMVVISNLWKRTSHITSSGLPVGQLELLYDIISACIIVNRFKFADLIPALEQTLTNFETATMKDSIDHMD